VCVLAPSRVCTNADLGTPLAATIPDPAASLLAQLIAASDKADSQTLNRGVTFATRGFVERERVPGRLSPPVTAQSEAWNTRLMITVLSLTLAACSSPMSPSAPNVQGFWHGGWVADSDSCTGNTPYCDLVRGGFVVGDFNLRLTQSGKTLRAFIYVCGNELDPVTGMLAADGTITLSGQGALPFYDPMTLSNFQATISGTSMTGRFACTVNFGSTSNYYSLTGTLKGVSLSSRDPNTPF
jgi:hypothetical protein